jgi:type II secretory pathway component PulF
VSAGEQSGKLDSVLERLSDYTESRQVMGQQVSNALVYPIVLLVLSFAIVSFLLAYVVPQVVAVFESGHQELPFATRLLIGMSDLVRLYWYYAVIVIGSCNMGLPALAEIPGGAHALRPRSCSVPLAGKLIRGVNTARFSRTFSILTASAVPVLEALRISAEVVNNLPMKQASKKRPCACARARHRQIAGRPQGLPAHDDSLDQQRREQRRIGKDAGACRHQSGTRNGRPAVHHDQSARPLHGGFHGRCRHVHRHCTAIADFQLNDLVK